MTFNQRSDAGLLMDNGMARKGRTSGVYSTRTCLADIDKRSTEGRMMAQQRIDLARHVGGVPTVTQRALIERVVWLTLHMGRIDAKTASGGDMTDHDHRHYLAWANTLSRILRTLGLQGAPAPVQTLDELRQQAAA